MRRRKDYILSIRKSINNIITYLALHLAYFFWRFATKRNPNLGFACLDGLHKISFFVKDKIQSQAQPEPKQAQN
jgi:hypothetical protein